jgi:hypothetical protein
MISLESKSEAFYVEVLREYFNSAGDMSESNYSEFLSIQQKLLHKMTSLDMLNVQKIDTVSGRFP